MGEKQAIFPKCPFKRACPFYNRQLLYTGYFTVETGCQLKLLQYPPPNLPVQLGVV